MHQHCLGGIESLSRLLEIKISMDGEFVKTKSLFISYLPLAKEVSQNIFSLGAYKL